MICISDKKNCCGCAACAQKCPKNCISMAEDKEGFLYPSVNEDICIDCGICETVCPILNRCENPGEPDAYAAYAKDNVLREKSSSGAVFSLCAEKILDEEGVVFGAAFDENFSVHHISVQTKEELDKLRSSKYLQSKTESAYFEAEQFLKQGKKVLYSGTACQIAGLKKFLKKEYENLFTIDVLCHGVPSPKVWNTYLSEKEKLLGKGKSVSFRNKSTGWKSYSVNFLFEGGNEIKELASANPYMRLFLSDICLRPSCHDCRYKSMERPADITLGDSWGIGNYKPHMDDDKGVSVVLIHSEKGRKMFDKCKENMVFEKAELNKILPPAADSRNSVAAHPKRNEFFRLLNEGATVHQLTKLIEAPLSVKVKNKVNGLVRKFVKK